MFANTNIPQFWMMDPTTMATKRKIAVSLYHRDHLSEGKNRQIFGFEAYHWAILVMPMESRGPDCDAYDATDASFIDPVTFRMHNPAMDWRFRDRYKVDPEKSSKLIGRIVIGTVEDTSTIALKALFSQVPLPVKNTHPQQSCVTWVVDAIVSLQKNGLLPAFDVDEFKEKALRYADQVYGRHDLRKIVEYLEM